MDRRDVVASFLDAKNVVLVGASAGEKDRHTFNARMTRSVLATAPGDVHLVNPSGGEVAGRVVHTSLDQLPVGAAELAVVVVPGAVLIETLQACRDRGMQSCLVVTGNLTACQRQALNDLVEDGLHVWGPNCVGFSNLATGLHAVAGEPPNRRPGTAEGGPKPSFAVVGQSGGALANISLLLLRERIRMRYFLSTGEESDVTTEDCLEYLLDDAELDGCFAFVESPRKPHRFRGAARRFADQGRPLVLVKVGRTEQSREVAMNHTGAMVGAWEEFTAACRSDGAIVCASWEEAADTCSAVARWRGKQIGRRISVFTSSGATGALACDLMDDNGLTVAELGESARTALLAATKTDSPSINPYDSTDAGGTGRAVGPYLEAVHRDPAVDVMTFLHVGGVYAESLTEALVSAASVEGPPLAVSWGGASNLPDGVRRQLLDAGVQVFEDPARLYRALGKVAGISRPEPVELPALPTRANAEETEVLSYGDSVRVLAELSVRRPASVQVSSAAEARAAITAGRVRLPLVAKGADVRGHKVQQGAVRLDLTNVESVTGAVCDLLHSGDAVLLEEQVGGTVELIVAARVSDYGRLLLIGAGGPLAELPGMSGTVMEPLTRQSVAEAIAQLPIGTVLAKIDKALIEVAADVAVSVVESVGNNTGIEEVEINPLRVDLGKLWALDAKVTRSLATKSARC